MARTIDYLTCMVDVTPYEHEGHNYDALNIIVAYRKGQGFCITWQPVKRTDMGYMTGPMPSSDPLVGGKGFVAKAANRNNVKELERMKSALLSAKDAIRAHFDARVFDDLSSFMGAVCYSGYTPALQQEADRFLNGLKSPDTNIQTPNTLNNQTTNTLNNQTTMKLNIKNNNQESANVANNAQVSNHEPLTVNREPSVNPEQEVEDAVIIEEQPTAQSQKPKAKKPTAQSQQYSVITYTTKKGGTACYLAGFKTEADAKSLADQLPHSISNSYRYNDKGEKVFVVSFGTRYVDAASSMCEALNAGKKTDLHAAIAKCHEIYNGAVAAGKAEREKKTQERKAERAKAKADELAKVKKANGLYSMEEVAAMMQRAMAGEDVPELKAVKEALKVA